MKRIGKATAAAVIGLGAIALAAAPVVADPGHGTASGGLQLAHMGSGPGVGPGMGFGMMGPGFGMGYGAGPGSGMHGMMGQGMMGMGQGMMGYGFGNGPAVPGTGWGTLWPDAGTQAVDKDLSVDDVRERLDQDLKWHGNERLKVGDVTQSDDDTIVAEIVTIDGSLVQRLEIDRHSGRMQQVN